MPLTYKASASAGDYKPVPAGSHIAICDMVVDVGLQPGSAMYPKPKRQVVIRFELPNERVDFEKDGKMVNVPAVISKTYTASMNEKANLRHDLESWRGKTFTDEEAEAFDVSAILGKPCMISVMHSQKGDRTYANIAGIGALPKGISPKTIIAELPLIYYAPDDVSKYKDLPEWMRKKIDAQIIEEPADQAPEAEKWADGAGPLEDGTYVDDSDIPF